MDLTSVYSILSFIYISKLNQHILDLGDIKCKNVLSMNIITFHHLPAFQSLLHVFLFSVCCTEYKDPDCHTLLVQ